MKGTAAGPRNREKNMELMIKDDFNTVSCPALAGMVNEIRQDIAYCEQRKRKDYAALADIARNDISRPRVRQRQLRMMGR
jgi:hypothetical protein